MGQMGLTLGQIGLAARPTSTTVQASSQQLSSFFHRKSQTVSTIGTPPLEGPIGRHISNSDILRFVRSIVSSLCLYIIYTFKPVAKYSRSVSLVVSILATLGLLYLTSFT
jgi:hypothetical protein